MLSPNYNIQCFLALSAIQGVGYETLRSIAEKQIPFSDIVDLNSSKEAADVLRSNGARIATESVSDWASIRERILTRSRKLLSDLNEAQVQVIDRSHPMFPKSLLDLSDAPHWLFVQGSLSVLSEPSIAVVGTRSPSDKGLWVTEYVGLCLNYWGCPTVSGLALGIDQKIHVASIEANLPTIAVLGTGIFSDYPKNASELRRNIVRNGGAIITEYLPNETYSAKNFVRRNRLQAALAKVLIPTEWAAKSGTAHTVQYAKKLKRAIATLSVYSPGGGLTPPSITAPNFCEFAIPGEEEKFREFVREALQKRNIEEPIQQNLFEGI
ncbi:DNA-protecting protein DprA [Thalassospira sp. A40-3]|uniref:DNA-processing protein DprA n=1 Tax=Thalassospira sp. A40-3 TaxID=2785908 RepID=UPI0018CDC4EC|nr:DNA-processing protein DprA [Thalassospira sp. A40-3]QPO12968.1 DNA-protecting protein DprA [Thalassospira sp. A40-3]